MAGGGFTRKIRAEGKTNDSWDICRQPHGLPSGFCAMGDATCTTNYSGTGQRDAS